MWLRKFPQLYLLLRESWPVLIIVLAITAEIAHIATSDWREVFLYHSDSLTLPAVKASLAQKEPFDWIFSSQIFLFPEGALYAIASLVTTSIKASLVFNAYLNVVLLYALLRLMVRKVSSQSPVKQIYIALGCTFLPIMYMLLERNVSINQTSIATIFLFNTYYYGLILSALLLLLLTLHITQALPAKTLDKRKRSGAITLFSVVVITALTSFSNPLFILQFSLPFLLTVVVLFLVNQVSFRAAFLLSVGQLIGIALGSIARVPFDRFFAADVNQYIQTYNIPLSLTTFHQDIVLSMSRRSSKTELLMILLVYIVSVFVSLLIIYKITRGHKHAQAPAYLLLSLFASIAPVVIVIGVIITGNATTRYFIPLAIFPLLGLLQLVEIKLNFFIARLLLVGSTILLIGLGIWGFASVHTASSLLNNTQDISCLAKSLNNQKANGVGEYWTVRKLDVYGQKTQRVLQVNPNFTIYPWLNNIAAYHRKDFNFVVVDEGNTPTPLTKNAASVLGTPTKIYTCSGYYVYMYSRGSPAYKKLNQIIDSSYEALAKQRAQ